MKICLTRWLKIFLLAAISVLAAPPESICSGNTSRQTAKEVRCKNLYHAWDDKIKQAVLVYAEPGKPSEYCVITDETYWTYRICDDNGFIRGKRETSMRAKQEGKFKRVKITR